MSCMSLACVLSSLLTLQSTQEARPGFADGPRTRELPLGPTPAVDGVEALQGFPASR